MNKEDEETEKQHEEVIKQIKSENLIELYRHRDLLNLQSSIIGMRGKIALSRGEPMPAAFGADQEIAIRETLKCVEQEIKIKESKNV